ncbi:MAG: hypothetical protein JRI95_08215 [Deltaproteobacteria bacterium]|nr:hypothetical protein [Deltaproteobacteria bacterium]
MCGDPEGVPLLFPPLILFHYNLLDIFNKDIIKSSSEPFFKGRSVDIKEQSLLNHRVIIEKLHIRSSLFFFYSVGVILIKLKDARKILIIQSRDYLRWQRERDSTHGLGHKSPGSFS